jgi:hypothetical protein
MERRRWDLCMLFWEILAAGWATQRQRYCATVRGKPKNADTIGGATKLAQQHGLLNDDLKGNILHQGSKGER